MSLVSWLLSNPLVWQMSQWVFGCDDQKRRIYRAPLKGGGRILDFGCANGNTFPAFADLEYYGIDLSPELIEDAQKKYASHPSARFVCADILKKPFEDGFFDHILFAGTGHHLPDAPLVEILHALAAMLKDGGRFYYFDTIRDPKRESWLLNTLIGLDQGKDMRYEGQYDALLPSFPKSLKLVERKTFVVGGTFMPQPTYFYLGFEKTGVRTEGR